VAADRLSPERTLHPKKARAPRVVTLAGRVSVPEILIL